MRKFDMSVLGKFAVIMADPPWDIHMELPYGTMSDDEMRSLNVPCLQDEGYIFLWVTGRWVRCSVYMWLVSQVVVTLYDRTKTCTFRHVVLKINSGVLVQARSESRASMPYYSPWLKLSQCFNEIGDKFSIMEGLSSLASQCSGPTLASSNTGYRLWSSARSQHGKSRSAPLRLIVWSGQESLDESALHLAPYESDFHPIFSTLLGFSRFNHSEILLSLLVNYAKPVGVNNKNNFISVIFSSHLQSDGVRKRVFGAMGVSVRTWYQCAVLVLSHHYP